MFKNISFSLFLCAIIIFSFLLSCNEESDSVNEGDNDNINADAEYEDDIVQESPNPAQWGPYGVGAKTYKFIDQTRKDRLIPVLVNYPAASPAVTPGKPIADFEETTGMEASNSINMYAHMDATPLKSEVPYPILVFSHGSGSHKAMQKYLLEYLASHGYVVIAMDHTGNVGLTSMYPEDLTMTVQRLLDVRFATDMMLKEFADTKSPFAEIGDTERMAIAGYSYGGHIALSQAGATYDYDRIKTLCEAEGGAEDPYICPLLDARNQLEAILPDNRYKAVISLAHDASRFYYGANCEGMSGLKIPSFFFAATEDIYAKPEQDAIPCHTNAAKPSYELTLINAGHIGFTDFLNDGSMKIERMHEIVQTYMTAFLGYYLKGVKEYQPKLSEGPNAFWPENHDDVTFISKEN